MPLRHFHISKVNFILHLNNYENMIHVDSTILFIKIILDFFDINRENLDFFDITRYLCKKVSTGDINRSEKHSNQDLTSLSRWQLHFFIQYMIIYIYIR